MLVKSMVYEGCLTMGKLLVGALADRAAQCPDVALAC